MDLTLVTPRYYNECRSGSPVRPDVIRRWGRIGSMGQVRRATYVESETGDRDAEAA